MRPGRAGWCRGDRMGLSQAEGSGCPCRRVLCGEGPSGVRGWMYPPTLAPFLPLAQSQPTGCHHQDLSLGEGKGLWN